MSLCLNRARLLTSVAAARRSTSTISLSSSSASTPIAARSASCTMLTSSPSSLFLSPQSSHLHTSSALGALFGSSEENKAKAEEKMMKAYWEKFTDIMLRDKFNLQAYEDLVKLQAGESGAKDSLFDRAKMAVGQKLRSLQGEETPAALKELVNICSKFTPEEKQNSRLINAEAKKRVAEASNVPVADVTLLLCRLDQFQSYSEWFRWRKAEEEDLPQTMPEMWDMMRDDRKSGKRMPRYSAMDARMKAMRPKGKRS